MPARDDFIDRDLIPRRNRVDQWTPAEAAIGKALEAVEAAGADPRLTDAVNLLQAARQAVADFVDDAPRRPYSMLLGFELQEHPLATGHRRTDQARWRQLRLQFQQSAIDNYALAVKASDMPAKHRAETWELAMRCVANALHDCYGEE